MGQTSDFEASDLKHNPKYKSKIVEVYKKDTCMSPSHCIKSLKTLSCMIMKNSQTYFKNSVMVFVKTGDILNSNLAKAYNE